VERSGVGFDEGWDRTSTINETERERERGRERERVRVF
jgi:hypothetical protein